MGFGRKRVDGANATPMTSEESAARAKEKRDTEDAAKRLELARRRSEEGTPGWAKLGQLGGAHRADKS